MTQAKVQPVKLQRMQKRYLIFVLFLSAYFLSYFFRSTNAVIADDLVRDLALSPAQLGAMTGVLFGAFALIQFPMGLALDHFGERRTTGLLLLLAALGSFVFAAASNYGVLVLGRALIGLGVAGALMGSLKAISYWFPDRFATASGIFVALGASGALFATTPLELVSNALGWRQVFVAGAVVTVASSVLLLLFATRPQPVSSPEAQTGAGHILSSLSFWRIALLNFALAGSYFGYQSLWMGPFLTDGLALSSVSASRYLLLLSGTSVVGYSTSGWFVQKLGVVKAVAFSTLLFFLVQFVLAFYTGGQGLLVLLMIAFGFLGAFNITVFSHLRALFPAHLRGRAFAFGNFFGFAGIALSQWFLGIIVGRFPLVDGAYAAAAFRAIFLTTSLFGLFTVVLYFPFLLKARQAA